MKDLTGQEKVKRGFFARMIEKLDKKMEEKAREGKCCGGSDKKERKSCCS
ncbi:MAG: hypothetical protein Q8N62_08360 [Candidatus Omnitrophota bacterium]|nr:hypothetical protein [Candidatus Omnitrophota bacterium]